jgi:hypothetical protein
MAEIKDNLLEEFKNNPRSFRRTLSDYGLFCRLPIEGSDDYRNEEITRIKYFWRWVIDRAILDIISTHKYTKEGVNSINWFMGTDKSQGKDFKFICHLADLEPELVYKYMLKIKQAKDELTQNGQVNIYEKKKQ